MSLCGICPSGNLFLKFLGLLGLSQWAHVPTSAYISASHKFLPQRTTPSIVASPARALLTDALCPPLVSPLWLCCPSTTTTMRSLLRICCLWSPTHIAQFWQGIGKKSQTLLCWGITACEPQPCSSCWHQDPHLLHSPWPPKSCAWDTHWSHSSGWSRDPHLLQLPAPSPSV